MNTKRFVLLFVVIIFAPQKVCFGFGEPITDVQISPEQPSIFDIITIESQGEFSSWTNWYDSSVLTVNELSIQLDLYFSGGSGPQVPQAWSHNEVVGSLPQGNYNLLVQMYWKVSGAEEYGLIDDYLTDFEVVPEPSTIAFLALGGLITKIKKRKENWL